MDQVSSALNSNPICPVNGGSRHLEGGVVLAPLLGRRVVLDVFERRGLGRAGGSWPTGCRWRELI